MHSGVCAASQLGSSPFLQALTLCCVSHGTGTTQSPAKNALFQFALKQMGVHCGRWGLALEQRICMNRTIL